MKLFLHNYLSHRSTIIDLNQFQGKVIYIQGLNGAGKSSLFSSVLWAFYGNDPRTRTKIKTDVIHSGKDVAAVKVTFHKDGKEYLICRAVDSSHRHIIKIEESGKDISLKNLTDNQNIIQNIVGFSYQDFLRLFYLTPTTLNFISMQPAERLNVFSNYLKFHIIDSLKSAIKKEFDKVNEEHFEVENKIYLLKGHINDLLDTINGFKEILGDLENDEKIKELEKRQAELIEKIEEVNNLIKEIEKTSDEKTQKQINDEIIRLNKYYSDIEEKISNLTLEYKVLKDISKPELNIKENRCAVCGSVLNKDMIERIKKDYQRQLEQYNLLLQKNSKIEEHNREIDVKIENLEKEKDEIEQRIKSIKEQYEKTVLSAHNNMVNLMKESRDLRNELNTVEHQISDHYQSISKLQSQIDLANQMYQNSLNEINGLQPHLEELKKRKDAYDYVYNELLSSKGLKLFVLNYVISLLNNEIKFISGLIDFNGHVEYIGTEDGLEVECSIGNAPSYSCASNGQKRLVDFIIAISFMSLFQSILNGFVPFIVVDEALDSLDNKHVENIVRLLKQVASEFSIPVFIISQNQEIGLLSNRILAIKLHNGESMVEVL